MAMNIEKLKKVVDMAKRGNCEGERANAERIARKACTELGLKYEDAVKGIYDHTGQRGNNGHRGANANRSGDGGFSYKAWDFWDEHGVHDYAKQAQAAEDLSKSMHDMYEEALKGQRGRTQQPQGRRQDKQLRIESRVGHDDREHAALFQGTVDPVCRRRILTMKQKIKWNNHLIGLDYISKNMLRIKFDHDMHFPFIIIKINRMLIEVTDNKGTYYRIAKGRVGRIG